MILLRVEDLEQGGGRVAAEVHRHLVDFVEQEDRVQRTGLLHHLNDLSRERPDIRPSMASDLCLVADAAKRQPDELPVRRPRDRLCERSLAYSGRSRERQDRALGLLDECADCKELEDAILDLGQAMVVFVEDGLCSLEVAALAASLMPRHGDQPVEVVARHGRFGRHRRHRVEALEFLDRLVLGVLRHLGLWRSSRFSSSVSLPFSSFRPSSFWIALHLLVEVVLLLRRFHLLLHARLDPPVDLKLVHLESRGSWRFD